MKRTVNGHLQRGYNWVHKNTVPGCFYIPRYQLATVK